MVLAHEMDSPGFSAAASSAVADSALPPSHRKAEKDLSKAVEGSDGRNGFVGDVTSTHFDRVLLQRAIQSCFC